MQFCIISTGSLVFDTVIHIEVIFAIVSFILDRLLLVKTQWVMNAASTWLLPFTFEED